MRSHALMLQETSATSMHVTWEDLSASAISGTGIVESSSHSVKIYELHVGIVDGAQSGVGDGKAVDAVRIFSGKARGCMLSGLEHCTSYRCILFESVSSAVDGKQTPSKRMLCAATFETLPYAPVRLSASRVVCIGSVERSVELSFEFPDVPCGSFVLEGRCVCGSHKNRPMAFLAGADKDQGNHKKVGGGQKDSDTSPVPWRHVRYVSAASRKIALDSLIANNVYEFRMCARNQCNMEVRQNALRLFIQTFVFSHLYPHSNETYGLHSG